MQMKLCFDRDSLVNLRFTALAEMQNKEEFNAGEGGGGNANEAFHTFMESSNGPSNLFVLGRQLTTKSDEETTTGTQYDVFNKRQ